MCFERPQEKCSCSGTYEVSEIVDEMNGNRRGFFAAAHENGGVRKVGKNVGMR